MHLVRESGPGEPAPEAEPPRSANAHGPSLALYLSEPARGAMRLAALPLALPWLGLAPVGDGHAVLVVPGLLATDSSTGPLRMFLGGLGYRVRGWQLGRNMGPTGTVMDGLPTALAELADSSGGPVSIVGWSLGGIFARELGRDHADMVRQVITLGSPFALSDPRQSRAQKAFDRRSHLHVTPGRLPFQAGVERTDPGTRHGCVLATGRHRRLAVLHRDAWAAAAERRGSL